MHRILLDNRLLLLLLLTSIHWSSRPVPTATSSIFDVVTWDSSIPVTSSTLDSTHSCGTGLDGGVIPVPLPMFNSRSLNFLNALPCNGLVKISAFISSVGQYSIRTSPFLMRSVIKKISDVDVPSPLPARCSTIFLKQYCTLIVLIDSVL